MKNLIVVILIASIFLSGCEIDDIPNNPGTYQITFQDGRVETVSCTRAEWTTRDSGLRFRCDGDVYFVISIVKVSDEYK